MNKTTITNNGKVSKTMLRKLGFTEKAIRDLLPPPEHEPNPLFGGGAPLCLWDKALVDEVMRSEAFIKRNRQIKQEERHEANQLRERCSNFIRQTNISVRDFIKRVGISKETYYNWQHGETELYTRTMQKIINYLDSPDAQKLLERGKAFLPISECAMRTNLTAEKIKQMCKSGEIQYEKTSGNRWFVNIFDLERYLEKDYPGRFKPKADGKQSVFMDFYANWDEMWKPLISAHNDFEIFNSQRFEFDDRYWVSNMGNIYNSKTGNLMATSPDDEKYVRVNLPKDGLERSVYIHRLVAYTFCPNRHYKDYIHHINGKRNDNRATNLIWVTREEHGECHKLIKSDKKAYRKYINILKKDNQW